MDGALEEFEKGVAAMFRRLNYLGDNDLHLSIPWIVEVIRVFKSCQDDFQSLFDNNQDLLKNNSVAQKYYSDYCDLSMKGVNFFEAIRCGVINWMILLETVVSALDDESGLCEAGFRKAKIGLDELAKYMINEKHSDSSEERSSKPSKCRWNWFASTGQKGKAPEQNPPKNLGSDKLKEKAQSAQTISPSWSAFEELKEISACLGAHKRVDSGESNGFIRASYTMTYVFYVVIWTLVAAFPCQGRGLNTRFYLAYNFKWGDKLRSLYTKIAREFQKEERKDSSGLLKEIHDIEKCAHHIRKLAIFVEEEKNETKKRMDRFKGLADTLKMKMVSVSDTDCIDKLGETVFSANQEIRLSNELKNETRQRVEELKTLIESLKNQLEPLGQKFVEEYKRFSHNSTSTSTQH